MTPGDNHLRNQILIVTTLTTAILLAMTLQGVMAQESLLDSSINQSGRWSFDFDQGDKLTGVLTCTAGTLDLLVWLNDATSMHRQRAWEGQSIPFSWVIPATGNWTVEVFDAQVGICLGWIKLDVERAAVAGGLGFALDPTGRTVLLGLIVILTVVAIGVVGYTIFQRSKKPKKPQKAQNVNSKQPQPHSFLHVCARPPILFRG